MQQVAEKDHQDVCGAADGATDLLAYFRHGDSQANALPRRTGRSIRPGTAAVPATVLICDMGSGALDLKGWRIKPSVYLTADDGAGLRREPAKAFGSKKVPPRDDPGQAL